MAKEYIEREAAKAAIVKAIAKGHSAFNAIVAIPSADVRPVVHAKWIDRGFDEYECSNCGALWTLSEGSIMDWHGCPTCLADMREVQDG